MFSLLALMLLVFFGVGVSLVGFGVSGVGVGVGGVGDIIAVGV